MRWSIKQCVGGRCLLDSRERDGWLHVIDNGSEVEEVVQFAQIAAAVIVTLFGNEGDRTLMVACGMVILQGDHHRMGDVECQRTKKYEPYECLFHLLSIPYIYDPQQLPPLHSLFLTNQGLAMK